MSILINDGRENEDIMKCDIGELVLSVEKFKSQTIPFVKVFRNIQSVVKWERPLISIVTMVVSCYILFSNPVYMLLLCISPFFPILVIGLLRRIGASKVPNKTYQDFFVRKDDEYTKELFSQEEKRKHLNMYLNLLVQLQKSCIAVNKIFDRIYSIIFWKEKKLSLLILVMLSCFELMIYTFDMNIVLCVLVLIVFLCNAYLVKAICDSVYKMKTSIHNLFTLKSSSNKYQGYKETSINECVDSSQIPMVDREETHDDEISDTSSSSDTEPDEPAEMKMTSSSDPSKEMANSGSMMSKFLPRTWRRRNVENCSQCYQPVSSILKKRRYCRHCGQRFCSRCCHDSVPRSFLGATAPAAYQGKVLVCTSCHKFLTNRLNSPTEIIE